MTERTIGVVDGGRGLLDLDFESVELSSAPGLQLNVYTAAGTPTADALKLLAPGGASPEDLLTEARRT